MSDGGWEAEFELDFSAGKAVPEQVDFLALANVESNAGTGSPQLHRFAVKRTRDQSLEVGVDGPDQIGFLGRLLSRISLLSLFPTEIEIDTVAGRIHDRIVFRGSAGMVPRDGVDGLLENMLRGLIVPPV